MTHVPDFSGLFTRVKPEVFTAMGDSSGDPMFQTGTSVVVHGTRCIKMGYDVYASLLTDSFKIILKGVFMASRWLGERMTGAWHNG